MMEYIETQKSDSPLLHVALEMDKSNFKFRRFRLLPELIHFNPDPRWMAKAAEIKIETALEWTDILLTAGIWSKANGTYKLIQKEARLSGGIEDHLALAASIQSRLTDDGPCWFESWTLTTNEELYREFLKTMNQVMTDFNRKSLSVKGDKIVSFDFNIIREIECDSMKGNA